jgi:protein-S-isoprenylcysteine O-methyltransferase Ste14
MKYRREAAENRNNPLDDKLNNHSSPAVARVTHHVFLDAHSRNAILKLMKIKKIRFALQIDGGMLGRTPKAKLYDLASVAPLILWLMLGIAASFLKISETPFLLANALVLFAQIAVAVLFFLMIILLVIRRTPRRKLRGLLPRLSAIAGCMLPIATIVLPRGDIPPLVMNLSSLIVLLGVLASIAAVYYLGRSFSIFPQARALKTDGPYRFVRHPLYLAEFMVLVGGVWEINQPWPLIISIVALGIQITRMNYEEQVLSEVFPDYREYAKRTARIIPGLY